MLAPSRPPGTFPLQFVLFRREGGVGGRGGSERTCKLQLFRWQRVLDGASSLGLGVCTLELYVYLIALFVCARRRLAWTKRAQAVRNIIYPTETTQEIHKPRRCKHFAGTRPEPMSRATLRSKDRGKYTFDEQCGAAHWTDDAQIDGSHFGDACCCCSTGRHAPQSARSSGTPTQIPTRTPGVRNCAGMWGRVVIVGYVCVHIARSVKIDRPTGRKTAYALACANRHVQTVGRRTPTGMTVSSGHAANKVCQTTISIKPHRHRNAISERNAIVRLDHAPSRREKLSVCVCVLGVGCVVHSPSLVTCAVIGRQTTDTTAATFY